MTSTGPCAEGRGLRRRRRVAATAGAVAAAVVAVAALAVGAPSGPRSARDPQPVARWRRSAAWTSPTGCAPTPRPEARSTSGAAPSRARRLRFLDTDATATPYGVLFYDRGVPRLLGRSGRVRDLEPGAGAERPHPTAKVDSQRPYVAYSVVRAGRSMLTVRNLATDGVVARHPMPRGAVIDGIDRGIVLLRTRGGTEAWDVRTDGVRGLAGPGTRVADVRNGVLLYTGPAPNGPAAASYRLVRGAIDAQLTYDGAHVLYWSSRLEPTGGGRPVVLDRGSTAPGPTDGWRAIDTDGSVLTAVRRGASRSEVYDCEVASGRCTDLGPLTTLHGDPMFIGVDM